MYYLLPSSGRQSKVRLKLQSSNSQGLHFPHFEYLRRELLQCAKVDTDLPPLPVWRRFKNAFWDSLEFWILPPPVQKRIEEHSMVLSPLYGLLGLSDLIPYYSLRWEDSCNGRSPKKIWKPILKQESKELFKGRVVFNFLGGEESLLDFSTAERVVEFEFYRKGLKVRGSSKHRAYVLRYIAERGTDLKELHRINFYDYVVRKMKEKGNRLRVIMEAEGRYI